MKNPSSRSLLQRSHQFLNCVEGIIESLSVTAVQMKGFYKGEEWVVGWRVRWWHPASWIGWFRCRVLGDSAGSAYFIKSVRERIKKEDDAT